MKKLLCTSAIILMFSIGTMPSVLAKPKLERGNPNNNYNPNLNISVDHNNNLPSRNQRSNAGGRLRGQQRAAYVHCLNAAKKNRESAVINNCSPNQISGQDINSIQTTPGIQQVIPNNLPINVTSTPKAQQ